MKDKTLDEMINEANKALEEDSYMSEEEMIEDDAEHGYFDEID